ncbi:MAG: Co2+/Mg2+ efflux protein ApaG [Cryomorphaceae bacterium]|nr:Co2+/Mg2+ efflux protein ApaG [Cryomorphaceae bacterium]
MNIAVTEGIQVVVETYYNAAFSDPKLNHFLFGYKISISNLGTDPVKLLDRHWDIVDGAGFIREVDGPGVIGLQPVIQPNTTFSYESACDFTTPIGNMSGYYVMRNHISRERIQVQIPLFIMEVPWLLN